MQCYTELIPPTAVSHSICFHFLGPNKIALIVARTSILQVFGLRTVQEELDGGDQPAEAANGYHPMAGRRRCHRDGVERSDRGASAKPSLVKLVLVAEYPLSGTVTSLAQVKIPRSKSGGDGLLVAFRDAKLSLVEWDPERHAISTVSIHYYERDDLERSPWAPELLRSTNDLTVDPRSRCAILTFGGGHVAILPFRQAGDDLVMDDDDPNNDDARADLAPVPLVNGDTPSDQRPYTPSFVLPLTTFDPSLVHPIHLAFLYEYRGPTFGILSSVTATSTANVPARPDVVTYTVFTLDLEQRASTIILSVTGLPYDLYRVLPLPPPVGGSLLIGTNELVHVDQAGKTNAVAVNVFAKDCSSFSMADQCNLGMKLESCTIQPMGFNNGDLLMLLSTGELTIVRFKLDGRTVSGVSIRRVHRNDGGLLLRGSPSCSAMLGKGRVFVGSEHGDSVILACSRSSRQLPKDRRQPQVTVGEMSDASDDDDDKEEEGGEGEEEEEPDQLEDDLYAGDDSAPHDRKGSSLASASAATKATSNNYTFRVHDRITSLAPINDVTFGASVESMDAVNNDENRLEMILAVGQGRAGSLAILKRELEPLMVGPSQLTNVQGVWSVRAKRPVAKKLASQPPGTATAQPNQDFMIEQKYDRIVIISKIDEGNDVSAVCAVSDGGLEEMTDTEFEPAAGGTVDVGVLGNGTRVVQVLKSEVRSYDGDFGLAQISPMMDESTGGEPKVLSASFADPYLVLIRDDFSVFMARCDTNGELDEMEFGEQMKGLRWSSGCLYRDGDGAFGKISKADSKFAAEAEIKVFLLTLDGMLHIYGVLDMENPLYVVQNINLLPSIISTDSVSKQRGTTTAVRDVLVAKLGDSVAKFPYMIFRTMTDEVVLYEPFHTRKPQKDSSIASTLRFLKISLPSWVSGESALAEQDRVAPMRVIPNLGGNAMVFIPGEHPGFLLRAASATPKIVRLRGKAIKGLSGFHTKKCESGLAYVNFEGVVCLAKLPAEINLGEFEWPMWKIPLGQEPRVISYHPPMRSYVVGTVERFEFELPKNDEMHRSWAKENVSVKPTVEQGFIKLLNPVNWSVVDSFLLPPTSIPLCISTVSLAISENNPDQRRQLICVGTSNNPITDLPSRGSIYIFDVIRVVPEPDRPETDRRFKLVSKEDVKGAVTALGEVGTQGFLLVAQGQKCMVRGLKEDGSLLPVAFIDVMCHVSSLRGLPGTGMCLMADGLKGVWFIGHSEEPYKMTVFSKSTGQLDVLLADFLPFGDQLYIVVADVDCNLHIMQYDPEHPRSFSGTHLLHLRAIHTGHFPTTMTRLPSTIPTSPSPSAPRNTSPTTPASPASTGLRPLPQQILLTSLTGSISVLTVVPETVYRRLLSVQSQLLTSVSHACGLNPKAHRLASLPIRTATGLSTVGGVGVGLNMNDTFTVSTAAMMAGGGGMVIPERAVLDGSFIARWSELDPHRRKEILSRVGTVETEFRNDLNVTGAGQAGRTVLGFL